MEVNLFRTKLLSSNSYEDFQRYVMVLTSIRCFLRADELIGYEDESGIYKGLNDLSFVKDLSFVTAEGIVKSLAIKVNNNNFRLRVRQTKISKLFQFFRI